MAALLGASVTSVRLGAVGISRAYLGTSLVLDESVEVSSHYRAVDGVIKSSGGTTFVPIGMNLLGHDAFWTTDPAGLSDEARGWGVNTVRLNSMLPGEMYVKYNGVTQPQYTMAGTAAAPAYQPSQAFVDRVSEYTAAGMNVMLALFLSEPGTWPTSAQRAKAVTYWTATANLFKDNPRVWFNLYNEPGSEIPVPQVYYDIHAELQDAIRGTGAQNLIVIDGTQWGQDHQYNTGQATVPTNESGILTWGPQLKANDPVVGGTAFSIHPYATYGTSSDPGYNNNKLGDFIDRVQAAGLSLMIGECGSYGNASPDDLFRRGAEAAYAVAPGKGVGILAWHGTPGDGFNLAFGPAPGYSGIFTEGLAGDANRTWHGKLLWALGLTSGIVTPPTTPPPVGAYTQTFDTAASAWPSPFVTNVRTAVVTDASVGSDRGVHAIPGSGYPELTSRLTTTAQDFEIRVDTVQSDISEQYARIIARGSGWTDPEPLSAYFIEWTAGNFGGFWQVLAARRASGSRTDIVPKFTTAIATTNLALSHRLILSSGNVKYRIWVTGQTEPATWTVDITDPSPITTAGVAALASIGGAAAVTGRQIAWDNLTVTQ